jgi:hypothetical protein
MIALAQFARVTHLGIMEDNDAKKRPEWPEIVVGGKYVRQLELMVRALRPKDAHGNRVLHLDDVLVCYLLAFFNPSIRSLRTVEDFSETRQAQRFIVVDRIPRSTLSDFHRLADPTVLQPIVDMLRREIQRREGPKTKAESTLPESLRKVLAVDGSFFKVAADVAWAFKRRGGKTKTKTKTKTGTKAKTKTQRGVRLDVHLDVETWIPEVVSVADGESEAEHAAAAIVPGAIHVYDRGIFSFELVAAHAGKANFVHRLREPGPRTPRFAADEERPLADDDRAAGVRSDRFGRLAGSTHRVAPETRFREVTIDSPNDPDGRIRLLTDLMDVPAHVIGLIYRHRWQVELFFRWLKSCARFRGVWSENHAGVLLQFYVALIAVLLMHLRTGMRPSKYALNLIGMVVMGRATWEEIEPILAKRERERESERARLARKRAEKTS